MRPTAGPGTAPLTHPDATFEVELDLDEHGVVILPVDVHWGTPPVTGGPPDGWDPGDPGYAEPDLMGQWTWGARFTAEGDPLPDWQGQGRDALPELRALVEEAVASMWEDGAPPFDGNPR